VDDLASTGHVGIIRAMTEEGKGDGRAGFAWLHRLDRAMYVGERTIVIVFLVAIAATMFLDVLYGRLVAQDSKIGKVLAKIAGVDDLETRTWIDQTVAPWIGLVLGVGMLWFALWTAEKHRGSPFLKMKQSALVMTLIVGLGVGLACWVMTVVSSEQFYLLVYVAAAGMYVRHLLRARPEGWRVRVGVLAVVVTPLYVYLALIWIPEGYTWSQELSLMMLLWIGFLGASVCAYEGKHLRMEAFDRLLPPKAKKWIHAVGFVAAAAFSAFLCILGWEYVTGPAAATESAQMGIPDRASIVSVPVAFAITTLRFIAAAASSALGGEYGRHTSESEIEAEKAAEHAAEEPVS
jgi:TRAP-type C4-dicarboxylate transport system permease small subunit